MALALRRNLFKKHDFINGEKLKEMRVLILIQLMLFLVLSMVSSQNIIDTLYYKSKYGGPQVSEKEGKVLEYIIEMPDGTICHKMMNRKGKKLFRQRCFKNGVPTGIWISRTGSHVDYNIEFSYEDTTYSDIPNYDLIEKKLINEIIGDFTPPVFHINDDVFQKYVAMNLRYPLMAMENGIQGKVISQFIIDEKGKVIELRIIQSADKILDAEAARVILNSPEWTPVKLDGKPIKVCIIVQTSFVLQ
ncbi:energy transducer TonB [Carboxylicivirga caseinilyticus]|uniref:energy transducer TonB n=1 Tax=Carboxylicivirga caseinilyticus TaxID=3417572 RepID=UPI003D35939B|nr:energy transducer TonB [Marinilabiliaceae bacterium A049]